MQRNRRSVFATGAAVALAVTSTQCARRDAAVQPPAPVNVKRLTQRRAPVPSSAKPQPRVQAIAAGRYRLVGSRQRGSCPRVALAARHIQIDSRGGTLVADVVNRSYNLTLGATDLIAHGSFLWVAHCDRQRLVEEWRLSVAADGSLAGTLESTWLSPKDCTTQCYAVFDIVAHPLRAR